MKKKLAFKNLFTLAWSDFSQNYKGWLALFGMQFISVCLFGIVLSAYAYCIGSSSLSLFNSSFFIIETRIFSIAILLLCCMFLMIVCIVYPIMHQQNALDLVFKRPMSGFDINNRFFSAALAMFFYYLITLLTYPIFFLGLFLSLRWRFVGLYILEHGGNMRQAFKASWRMTRGYVWFFIGIVIIEWILIAFVIWTIVGCFVVAIISYLIDARMYKQLHMEMDKDIEICSSCEN